MTAPDEQDSPSVNNNQPAHESSFPVVGIGASAGGLRGLEAFFSHTPADSGMAFIVIQHTDPHHQSLLPDLLSQYNTMAFVEVNDKIRIEPNCVYIIPRSREAAVMDGMVSLVDTDSSTSRMPIDTLFQSLAEDRHEHAMGVLLSGANTDGTLGLRAIKGYGGLTIVQSPESSEYNRMPQSAIDQGVVDFVLLPAAMPERLLEFVKHGPLSDMLDDVVSDEEKEVSLQRIFSLLRLRTGHDFSAYKKNTITRRISRRMMIRQMPSISSYLQHLQQEPEEVNTLFRELLVNVTAFFRDAPAFDVLQREIIPQIFAHKADTRHLRIWVAACATGEEAYSIAILCQEYLDELDQDYKIQIFATDISEESIQQARDGRYPANIASQVSPQRLQRFFTRQDSTYIVRKQIREMVTFAVQSLIKDPPFSNLDLVTCRNVLIYLEPDLQRKVIPLFHYVLNAKGYLFLGSAETVGEFSDLFKPIDRKWKIFQKLRSSSFLHTPFALPSRTPRIPQQTEPVKTPVNEPRNMRQLIEQMLLLEHVPPAAIINGDGNIIYLHRQTDKYLRPVTGEISINIVDMARDGLKLPLSAALRRAQINGEDVLFRNILVRKNGDYQAINLHVSRIRQPDSLRDLFLVMFSDVDSSDTDHNNLEDTDPTGETIQRIMELEGELSSTKQYLQAVVEELEASNEELKSINEELNASNEELQSANEELETATEELQSVNEELTTANGELEGKVVELLETTNELNDLIHNVDVGVIFLDRRLRIQRFTPQVKHYINLISGDIGRPLGDLVSKFEYDGVLLDDAQKVLDTLQPQRIEVKAQGNVWHWITLKPYLTSEGAIVGVVVTFINITDQKLAQQSYQKLEQSLLKQGYAALPFKRLIGLFEAMGSLQLLADDTANMDTLLDHACRVLVAIDDYDCAWATVLRLEDEPRLHLLATALSDETSFSEFDDRSRFPHELQELEWQAIQTRAAVTIPDMRTDSRLAQQHEALTRQGFVSLVALPIQHSNGDVAGVLGICSRLSVFSEHEVTLLEQFVSEVARKMTIL